MLCFVENFHVQDWTQEPWDNIEAEAVKLWGWHKERGELIVECDQLRAEVEHFKFLHQCESDSSVEAFARAYRAEAEVERLRECCDKTATLCGKFVTEDDGTDLTPNPVRIASALQRLTARADRAEAELLIAQRLLIDSEDAGTVAENLRAELAAAKLLLNEETDCAEAVEAAIVRQYARAERAEAEVTFQQERNSRLFEQRDAAVAAQEKAEAELAAERARLDWLEDHGWVTGEPCGRAAIDAAMKEGAK
jgi:hypothetical protein